MGDGVYVSGISVPLHGEDSFDLGWCEFPAVPRVGELLQIVKPGSDGHWYPNQDSRVAQVQVSRVTWRAIVGGRRMSGGIWLQVLPATGEDEAMLEEMFPPNE